MLIPVATVTGRFFGGPDLPITSTCLRLISHEISSAARAVEDKKPDVKTDLGG